MKFIPWINERKEREFQFQLLSVKYMKTFPFSLMTTTACTQLLTKKPFMRNGSITFLPLLDINILSIAQENFKELNC